MTTIKKVFYYLLLPLTAIAFIFKVLTSNQDKKVKEAIKNAETKDKELDNKINELEKEEAKIDGKIKTIEESVESVDENWYKKD